MPEEVKQVPTALARLDEHLRVRPQFAERMYRELLIDLHRRGLVTIDEVQDETYRRSGEEAGPLNGDPNQLQHDRLDDRRRDIVEQIIRESVREHFSVADVDDLVNLTLKREEVHSLEFVATLSSVSYRELAEKIHRFCELPLGETQLAPAEVIGTRVALIRHLISDQLEFIGIAKNFLKIRDFDDLTRRMIGNDSGLGRIGGKAGGMLLAYKVLVESEPDDAFFPVAIPDSYYLRSDVVEEFIRLNRLDQYQNQKYKPIEDLAREYPLIRGVFRNSDFPLKIVHELRRILERIGNDPLIVRSSSLLEDRFGTAFSGKYASIYVGNQGTLEQRLQAVLAAIAEVYASVMGPDPILYRREHNLIDYVEEMAVLIQRVVGIRHGDLLLPPFAGVAFSRNEYCWSPRIDRQDGFVRLVMGLGTRAVDRGANEYPRMVALGAPTLRPESSVQEILRGSQRTIDVVNLKSNRLESVRLSEVLEQGRDLPLLDRMVSEFRDGDLFMPAGQMVDADAAHLFITFDKLIRSTPFVARLHDMMKRLEDAYRQPIDLEFACDGEKFYVLQCRTLSQSHFSDPVEIPVDIAAADLIFDAHKYVRTGLARDLDYIVYVDPRVYDAVPTRERRVEIARVVGRVNRRLKPKSFALVGPGRWGSNDILLGVPITYADINRAAVLIEVALQKDGFSPEVSFGTHFFQDLVEAGIHYLPLYPDAPGSRFRSDFLSNSRNALEDVSPGDGDFANEVRVIHVPAVASGRKLTIAMDGETQQAVAYLKAP
jgi:hypothetical protein